jgi:hypothetical protein
MRNDEFLARVFYFTEGVHRTMKLNKDDELAAAINAARVVLDDQTLIAEAHPERHNSIDVR